MIFGVVRIYYNTMLKKTIIYCIGLLSIVAVSVLIKPDLFTSVFSVDPEERPQYEISEEEKLVNQRHIARYQNRHGANMLKSGLTGETYSYANGKLRGTWLHREFAVTGDFGKGYRVDGSVYDQYNDQIYAVSYAGHIYKIHRDESWELINHKAKYLNYIEGFNLQDNSFRMVCSQGKSIYYSDDEGRNWVESTGVSLAASTKLGGIVDRTEGKRIFIIGKSGSNFRAYYSDDHGISFEQTNFSAASATYEPKFCVPHYSDEAYIFLRNKTNSNITIYKFDSAEKEFKELSKPTQLFDGSLKRVMGTYKDDKFHFYVIASQKNIYYSSDEGKNWEQTNSGNTDVPFTIHPDQPNIIFKGYTDLRFSSDYGASFTSFSHKLGWDLRHAKMYQKKDSTYFHFVGKDFGCFISSSPEDKMTYRSLNYGTQIQMCYDGTSSENYDDVFTALQDRGCRGFKDENLVATNEVRSTDALRVTLAKNEQSVWAWMYFGSLVHKSNFRAKSGSRTQKSAFSNWWASTMVESPDPGEDAVIIATGSKLKKFTWDENSDKIQASDLSFDFSSLTSSKLTSFGYSKVNRDLWYAADKAGNFFYSTDGGSTYEKTTYSGSKPKANDQSYNYHRNQQTIKASDVDENKVYYAGVGKYFLISKDGGKTFTNHTNGLDVYRVRDFCFTPDEKFIFASCAGSGIWVFDVDANKWFEINDENVPNVNFNACDFIKKKSTVRFYSYGSGVLDLKLEGYDKEISFPGNLEVGGSNGSSIMLQWLDNADNETAYVIERTSDGYFEELATIAANSTSYQDESAAGNVEYTYRVKAKSADKESYYSNYVLASYVELDENEVDKSKWTLVSVSSEERNASTKGYATYAFDNDNNSKWHSQWYNVDPKPGFPHELVIDMNDTITINSFSYLPRQDGNENGRISEFEFYCTLDTLNWGVSVTSGTWANTGDEKIENFTARTVRFIKLIAKSEVNGKDIANVAEINVFKDLATSLEDNRYEVSLKVYPNPFSHYVNVACEPGIFYFAQIRDISGKIILQEKLDVHDSNHRIDIAGNLNKGMYILELLKNDGTGSVSKKILKE